MPTRFVMPHSFHRFDFEVLLVITYFAVIAPYEMYEKHGYRHVLFKPQINSMLWVFRVRKSFTKCSKSSLLVKCVFCYATQLIILRWEILEGIGKFIRFSQGSPQGQREVKMNAFTTFAFELNCQCILRCNFKGNSQHFSNPKLNFLTFLLSKLFKDC